MDTGIFSQNPADPMAIVREMTDAEKADFLSGQGMWRTRAIPRLGIPSVLMTDGAYGVRYPIAQIESDALPGEDFAAFLAVANRPPAGPQVGAGGGETMPATVFPNGSSLACSWDIAIAREMGAALAAECRALGINILLGPGMNIRRNPLAGRSFEYYSEDPYLAGDLAAAVIQGLQQHGVAATLKHFACNNSEIERTTMNSVVDMRALREIYLKGFERAVAKSRPWLVMTSYNPLNGSLTPENAWLLTEVLRDEWSFDGVVVSDWHAIKDRPRALAAGNDLDMPASATRRAALAAALADGRITPEQVDAACVRLLALVRRCKQAEPAVRPQVDLDAHHRLARRIAGESMVLLKNDGILPLDRRRHRRIAIIGRGAITPFIQGSGSATTRPWKVDSPIEALKAAVDADITVTFHDEATLSTPETLASLEAVDVVILFVDTGPGFTGEGSDRKTLHLDAGQDAHVATIATINPNLVVVVSSPDAVEMPWIDLAPAVLATFYSGQAMGSAVADILFGLVNPSGKLATSFPLSVRHVPGYLSYPGELGHHVYSEGVYVGYRWYDSRGDAVLFPFGHGLSYTRFEYAGLRLSHESIGDGDILTTTFELRNAGDRAGQEVCQLYARYGAPTLHRPRHELKAFVKVSLEPGETRTVTMNVPADDLRYYDPSRSQWILDNDHIHVEIGASSRDIHLEAPVATVSAVGRYRRIDWDTQPGFILDTPPAREAFVRFLIERLGITPVEAGRLLETCRGSFFGIGTTLDRRFNLQIGREELMPLIEEIHRTIQAKEESDGSRRPGPCP